MVQEQSFGRLGKLLDDMSLISFRFKWGENVRERNNELF